MRILVVNCGSSSAKLDLLDAKSGARLRSAKAERLGTEGCRVQVGDEEGRALPGADHATALTALLPPLLEGLRPDGVAHRVVHGGERFVSPTRIDASVEDAIEALSPLAPLHNPANLAGIRAARALLPELPHVAIFDTAFHATLPPRARAYALPAELAAKHGLRRYGFHGPSHAFVAERAAAHLGEDVRDLKIVTCHLGNGASVTAVEHGRSVETSMGMTPLEGLVMGTRAGDVDPGVLLWLMRAEKLDVDGLDELLNERSGLAGLSGVGNDLRDIEARAAGGDERCRLALHVFTHRARKYVGAYAAVMGGLDLLVFTAGIGENSALVRHGIAQRLGFLGARLDEDRNRDAKVSREEPVALISEPNSRVRIAVVATNEAHALARDAAHLLAGRNEVASSKLSIPVAVSARHVHLTEAAVEALFGKGHVLTPQKPLSQPGQFACVETVTVVGPKRTLESVRVLGPPRPKCQIEISRTDEFHLGVDAPIRDSGDVDDTPGVTLVGPAGTLTLEDGLVCAKRHIHMAPADAERFGVKDRDLVEVALDTEGRDLIFRDVLVRVSPKFSLEMHLDTDEANAAELRPGVAGVLEVGGSARLVRRSAAFD